MVGWGFEENLKVISMIEVIIPVTSRRFLTGLLTSISVKLAVAFTMDNVSLKILVSFM